MKPVFLEVFAGRQLVAVANRRCGDHDHDPQFELRVIKSPRGYTYRLHTDDYTWQDEESRGIGWPDVTEEFHICGGPVSFFPTLAEAKARAEKAARIDAHIRERKEAQELGFEPASPEPTWVEIAFYGWRLWRPTQKDNEKLHARGAKIVVFEKAERGYGAVVERDDRGYWDLDPEFLPYQGNLRRARLLVCKKAEELEADFGLPRSH